MDNLPELLKPIARRAIRTLQNNLLPFTTLYPPLPSPAPTMTSNKNTPDSQMSIMFASTPPLPPPIGITRVPTPPSRVSTPILTGSEFILPTKTQLSASEQARATGELEDAMARDSFKTWPTIEEYDVPLSKNLEGKTGERYGGKAKRVLEGSALFMKELATEERKRKEEILREWKGKAERDIENRRRVPGGLEDVMDNEQLERMWDMRPTLQGYVPAQASSKGTTQEKRDREGWAGPRRNGKKGRNNRKVRAWPAAPLAHTMREKLPLRNYLEQVEEKDPLKAPRRLASKPAYRYLPESEDDNLVFRPR